MTAADPYGLFRVVSVSTLQAACTAPYGGWPGIRDGWSRNLDGSVTNGWGGHVSPAACAAWRAARPVYLGAPSLDGQKLISDLLAGRYTPQSATALVAKGKKALDTFRERAARLLSYAKTLEQTAPREAAALRREAAAILKMDTWGKIERAAYTYISGKSRVLEDLLKKEPELAALYKGVGTAVSTFKSFQAYSDKIAKSPRDVTSAVDVMAFGYSAVSSVAHLLSATGAVPPEIAGEVIAWTGVLTGCVSGLVTGATAGAALGPWGVAGGLGVAAVACGVSFAGRLIGKTAKSPPGISGPLKPRTVYTPNSEQYPFVVKDAVRVAQQLRYTWSIRSWRQVVNTVLLGYSTPYLVGGREGTFPPLPPTNKAGQIEPNKAPIGGFSLEHCAMVLETADQPAPRVPASAITKGIQAWHAQHGTATLYPRAMDIGWGPAIRAYLKAQNATSADAREMARFQDYPLSILDREIRWGRQRLADGKQPYQYIPVTPTGVTFVGEDYHLRDARSALRVGALIDLLAAYTRIEESNGEAPINAFLNTQGLPVRSLMRVGNRIVYSSECWTGFREERGLPRCQRGLQSIVRGPGGRGQWNWAALRLVGALRLRAALSLINAIYWWVRFGEKPNDMIASLPPLTTDGASDEANRLTYAFLRPPNIAPLVKGVPLTVRPRTSITSHRNKKLYEVTAAAWVPSTSTDMTAAPKALFKALSRNADRFGEVVRRAEKDAILDALFPPKAVTVAFVDPNFLSLYGG